MAIEAMMYNIASELGWTTLVVTYDYYQSAKCLEFGHLQYDSNVTTTWLSTMCRGLAVDRLCYDCYA